MGGVAALTGTRLRGTRAEGAIDVANGMALSVPDFLWGLVLILLFGVLLPVFHISGRVTPSLDLPFTTNFYLFESLLRLRLRSVGRPRGAHVHAGPGAGDSAGGDHRAAAEAKPEGDDAPRLRDPGPHQGLWRERR